MQGPKDTISNQDRVLQFWLQMRIMSCYKSEDTSRDAEQKLNLLHWMLDKPYNSETERLMEGFLGYLFPNRHIVGLIRVEKTWII